MNWDFLSTGHFALRKFRFKRNEKKGINFYKVYKSHCDLVLVRVATKVIRNCSY